MPLGAARISKSKPGSRCLCSAAAAAVAAVEKSSMKMLGNSIKGKHNLEGEITGDGSRKIQRKCTSERERRDMLVLEALGAFPQQKKRHEERQNVQAWRTFAMERKLEAERVLADLPKSESRARRRAGLISCSRNSNALPAFVPWYLARSGSQSVPDRSHFLFESFSCVTVLPGGDGVATLNNEGILQMSSLAGRTPLWKVRIGDSTNIAGTEGALPHGPPVLALIGKELIATCGWYDKKVLAWSAKTGEVLGDVEISYQGCLTAIAAVDDQRFVVGCACGEMVFYSHTEGKKLTQSHRIAAAYRHSGRVVDFAVCGERLASASHDHTAVIWDLQTCARLAVLSGDDDWVCSVDMDDRVVVTGCRQAPYVRVYSVENEYSCSSVVGAVNWVHVHSVASVRLLDNNYVLSASRDGELCIASTQSNEVVALGKLDFPLSCTTVISGNSIAVAGEFGRAAMFSAPHAAVSLLQKYCTSKYRA